MARDRQRAKQRRRRQDRRRRGRAQRGPPAQGSRRRARRRDGRRRRPAATVEDRRRPTSAPDPLEHASADVDQAKLAEAGAVPPEVGDADSEYDGGYDDFDDADRAPDEAEEDARRRLGRPRRPRAPVRKQRGRVLTFLRHCVDELRRVQWPDRRQVGQATAVVLGFVVLAGGYLGLLDALWKPIIDAIL